ncbi:MAG: hypothetical protein GXP51_08255 [Deltaproteobacteria bacterium]|nr:hypothetical protein [Deltaproteobacteria bacterium]
MTNLLLLAVLTGILLVSGSLRCGSNCLPRSGGQYTTAIRIDNCHPDVARADPVAGCLNKACHQGILRNRVLSGPKLQSSYRLPEPLVSSSRQPEPQYRAGSIPPPTQFSRPPQLVVLVTSNAPRQAFYGIRTTVLLN